MSAAFSTEDVLGYVCAWCEQRYEQLSARGFPPPSYSTAVPAGGAHAFWLPEDLRPWLEEFARDQLQRPMGLGVVPRELLSEVREAILRAAQGNARGQLVQEYGRAFADAVLARRPRTLKRSLLDR